MTVAHTNPTWSSTRIRLWFSINKTQGPMIPARAACDVAFVTRENPSSLDNNVDAFFAKQLPSPVSANMAAAYERSRGHGSHVTHFVRRAPRDVTARCKTASWPVGRDRRVGMRPRPVFLTSSVFTSGNGSVVTSAVASPRRCHFWRKCRQNGDEWEWSKIAVCFEYGSVLFSTDLSYSYWVTNNATA